MRNGRTAFDPERRGNRAPTGDKRMNPRRMLESARQPIAAERVPGVLFATVSRHGFLNRVQSEMLTFA